jgi:hypothetical protein
MGKRSVFKKTMRQGKRQTSSHRRDATKPSTARTLIAALRKSGLVGMWKERTDIGESTEFAGFLRERAQSRRQG